MPSGAMRSVDPARFAQVPRPDVPRSAFDIRHLHKTTFTVDYLVPMYVDEVLPGDSVSLKMHAFARTATAIVPYMDNLIMETFFFFCPYRLVWSNFERMMGEQLSPADTTNFLMPQVVVGFGNCVPHTIYDYFGITMNNAVAGSISVNALPFRAYNLIWNDWFRDEDLDTPVTAPVTDGPDAEGTFILLQRRKRPDYFTTARPWPQKPTNVQDSGLFNIAASGATGGMVFAPNTFYSGMMGAPVTGIGALIGNTPSAGAAYRESGVRDSTPANVHLFSNMRARATGAGLDSPVDIRVLVNDIRTAVMLQGMLERNARGGTRYAELVRSHFGVISPDARLQRPEYLGGGRSFISVAPVAQTSATGITGGSTNLGEQSGIGTVGVYDHGFSGSFTEHGCIIGMLNVRSDLTYQQGINRMWFRRGQFEFYWPGLAHLGEQAIISKEIFCDGTAGDVGVFGYQERWSEYKYKPSRTSGLMRSCATAPVDYWHFGEEFAARPTLNSAFVEANVPVERVLQITEVESQASFLIDALFEARWVRPMPVYSIPGLGRTL